MIKPTPLCLCGPILLFALLNSAIAVSIASFNGGTRTWYGMGRSGVLPTALGKVNPKRKTPVNSIHLEVGMQVVAFACVLIWGVSNVFLTWANAITIGLVLMYILANIGVVKYYLTEGRAQFNPLLHVVVPVIASAAGVEIEVADGRFSIAIVTAGDGWTEGDFGRQSVRKGQTFAWPASLSLRVHAGREPVRVVRCLGPGDEVTR